MSTLDDEARAALRRRFEREPDFINVKRFGYSLRRCEEKYPDGLPDDGAIAAAVCLTEEEIEPHMDRIAAELRDLMDVEVEEKGLPQLQLMLAPIFPRGMRWR